MADYLDIARRAGGIQPNMRFWKIAARAATVTRRSFK
jgi:hypothetical protein